MRFIVLIACFLAQTYAAQEDALSKAMEALSRGDLPSAEETLQAQLRSHPNDGPALEVLGVVLDEEKKYAEADSVYRRAFTFSPHSPSLLNNYGNHLLATGKKEEARKAFLEVISRDGGNANALVQLARLALEHKAGAEAISYLRRVPAGAADRPDVVLLRMQADYATGRTGEADRILERLSPAAQNSGGQSFALGVALSSVEQHAKAESLFSRALELEPGNFEALYDMGLAASHAGHYERARALLQQALEQQGQNVDVLYDLAAVHLALNEKDRALELLAKASRLAPSRADVLRLLARTSMELGYFADGAQSWSEYLKVNPHDEAARRERAFAETATGDNAQSGLADLHSFIRKFPNDPLGHYELGVAQAPQQPDLALREFEKALALKPDFIAAHVARGLLLYQGGKSQAALEDFQFAAERDPQNGAVLDRLGETYLALERPNDALPVLRRAAELMPSNSTVLLHLGRALSKSGHMEEASAVFARCRELGPNKSASPHPAGLIDFLSLSPEEQTRRYRAGVERTVRSNPANVEAQVRYMSILLDEGRTEEALGVSRVIAGLRPSAPLLAQAVETLLAAEQYTAAKDLLDQIPPGEQKDDYRLLRARIREAEDRYRAFNKAVLLLRNHHAAEASQLLNQLMQSAPDDPELLLLKAIAQALAGNREASSLELKKLETRWPDWYKVWLAHALILESQEQWEEARSLRQTAAALGAPAAASNLADALPVLFPSAF